LEKGIKINRLVLVSTPFSGEFLDHKIRKSVIAALKKGFDFDIIKKNSLGFTLLYDTQDYVVPIGDGEEFAKKLGVGVIKTAAQEPHFSAASEPQVLSVALGAIKVFTTRPDTLFGATYLVLAPEHPVVNAILPHVPNKKEVEKYINETKKKSELQRTQLEKEKTGVELKGIKVINPATKEEIPVWIADYVITGYGTGAIMAVPAHDERDFEFAQKFNLAIKQVVSKGAAPDSNLTQPITDHCIVINSGEFDGMKSEEVIQKIGSKFGKLATKYKLRDWLVSRQRYWGAPIPIIYCPKCGQQPVPEKSLPVKLPTDVDFRPTGESPLKRSKSFSKVSCPKCKGKAERDYDTMDTFVDSSWYFLRYIDPKNKTKFADAKKIKEWMPVNTYIGGAEHAVLHLLYSRFVIKALKDLKLVNFNEPFLQLRNIGLILGPDGEKMSKSRGNVINPDDMVKEFGADSLRMFEMFMGPLEDAKPWQTQGMVGVKRFLDRVWFWVNENAKKDQKTSEKAHRALHRLAKKITQDISNFSFNTCVSAFMETHNQIKDEAISKEALKVFLTLLYPFAPHICEELYGVIGGKKSLQREKWPKYDEKLTVESTVEVIVQVNGKVKGKLTVERDVKQDVVQAEAMKLEPVKLALVNETIKRVVYVPNRILNLVI
jgi:leucyl-tRNA synthetase